MAAGISVRAKGAGGGAAAPPEIFFSGKTAKIYVISKRFSGKMFGQTGFLPPPQVGKFFGQKENFFRANRCRPPKFGHARTPMAAGNGTGHFDGTGAFTRDH